MSIKSLRVGFVGLVLCAASAWAGPSAIQGIVKDPKGHPVKGADVRIEANSGSKLSKTVKTDANGHYISDGLPAGIYRVTLVVNGAVKASINNTKTTLGVPTQLNFDLKPTSGPQASASGGKGKHKVWVPATTGSHVGGSWVEVDDSGNAAGSTLNVQKVSAKQLEQQAHSTDMVGKP